MLKCCAINYPIIHNYNKLGLLTYDQFKGEEVLPSAYFMFTK